MSEPKVVVVMPAYTEIIAQAVAFGFTIGEIAVPTRYLLQRTHLHRSRQFDVRLEQVISRHHATAVLRRAGPRGQ